LPRVTLAAIGLKLRAIHLFGLVDVLVADTMNGSCIFLAKDGKNVAFRLG